MATAATTATSATTSADEPPVGAINSTDDERNPPETGLMAQAMKQVKNGKLYLILTRAFS
jgi:homoserine O-acetyltransferase